MSALDILDNDEARGVFYDGLSLLENICHGSSVEAGWYTDLETGEPKDRNLPEMICLMHSELSEMMEGVRKDLMDDKLPHRKAEEVEMADLFIRALDYVGYRRLNLAAAIEEKLRYNAQRADHKPENRAKENGKAF